MYRLMQTHPQQLKMEEQTRIDLHVEFHANQMFRIHEFKCHPYLSAF